MTAATPGAADGLPPDRAAVASERRHPGNRDLHALDIPGILERIQAGDAAVPAAVAAARPAIAAFLAAAEPGFVDGGRLVYLGAGTSGRLGVLDASECPPTFLVPPTRVVGLIAGGEAALRRSSEGLEDDPAGAIPELAALDLGPRDSVLGIAAGGTTPWVRGGLRWCAELPEPPVTGLLSCAPVAPPHPDVHVITVATGPELIAGSTRLQAGTATKLVLNAVSTTLMIRAGRVYENLMVDVSATNDKLRDRAARIVAELTDLDRAAAFALLAEAGGRVKTAVVMARLGIDRASAERDLARAGDRLDALLP